MLIPIDDLLEILSQIPLTSGIPKDELLDIISDIPLADLTFDELLEILEDFVPKSAVPETGDSSWVWEVSALLSGAELAWLIHKNRRRGEDAE